jgi:two-component sensor histidine kinase
MEYLRAHGFSDDTVQSLGMVASELCENAIKYGAFPDRNSRQIEVLVRPGKSLSRVLVRVTGPVQIGNNPHFRRFKETLDWLQDHENPMEAYLERMQLAAWTRASDEESGLGLPRIAYEGQSLLSYELDDQDRLAVCAIHYPGRD